MAIFHGNGGRLKEIQTSDLSDLLGTLAADERINLMDLHTCLGARTAMMLVATENDPSPCVEYGIFYGTVKGRDMQYEIGASFSAGSFISDMIVVQNDIDGEFEAGIPVSMLRTALNEHTAAWIKERGVEAAL